MKRRGKIPAAGCIGLLAALALAAPGVARAAEQKAPALLRGPYVQCGSSDSVVIVWRTVGKIRPVVKYGTRAGALDRALPAGAILAREDLAKGVGSLAADDVLEDGTCQYEAHVAGLEPMTTYYYAVYDADRLLGGGDDSYRFRTYPAAGKETPLRFAAFGDSHGAGWHKTRVEDALRGLCTRENRPVDLYLHLGDQTSKGRNKEYQYLFEPQDVMRRTVVMWPTLGNHDIVASDGPRISGPYCDAFVLPANGESRGTPSGTEAFYSFDYGRVHFISLASFHQDRGPEGPMARWLAADLARAKAGAQTDWVVAFFHTPVFTCPDTERQRDAVEMRAFILPILEAGGVDLILGGHMHEYERSMLVDGIYATPMPAAGRVLDDGDGDPAGDGAYRKSAGVNPHEGTVAVTVGIGGGPPHEGVHPVARRYGLEGGMLVVDVDADTLTARMMRADGVIRDTFSIVKRGKVAPDPAAKRRAPEIAVYFRKKLPWSRAVLVPFLQEPVKMDGVLDDPAWRKALTLRASRLQQAGLLARADALYVGVDFWTGAHPKARETRRDGPLMALDSTVELYLDLHHDGREVYRFACNCAGVKYDEKDGDPACDPDWEVKTVSGVGLKNEHWIAEMRIPWASIGLGRPPDENTVLGMNLLVNNGGTGAAWFPGRGDSRYTGWQRPEYFAYVRLGAGRLQELIPPHDNDWRYLDGGHPPEGWTGPDFQDKGWKVGAAGFGYGDIDNSTRLPEMKGSYSSVYARRTFDVADRRLVTDMAILIAYDDAFIAYLNGKEVLRVGVREGSGRAAAGVAVHEGAGPERPPDQAHDRFTAFEGLPLYTEMFSLRDRLPLLRNGVNVLAIEGHNATPTSKAFTLDPYLIAVVRE